MKTNKIIESLRYCAVKDPGSCKNCPAYRLDAGCLDALHKAAADTLETQQKRIAELEAERRWIPVTERLPKQGTVLVTDGNIVITAPSSSVTAGGQAITHWMPLPEPPKEGT